MKHFRTSDGLSLAFEDEGAGTTILCLPGLTRNARDFDDLAAALGGMHRLIRLTFRGRGASDRDPNPMNYHPAIEARDVIELLNDLGLDRAVIVGTSRGGLVAMVLAAMAKDRLAGVLLNDIGPELAPEGLAAIMTYLGVAPKAKTLDEAAKALEARMGAAFPGLSAARWVELAGRWFDEGPDGLTLNYDPKLRDALEAASAQPAADTWPLFDALADVPVAVVRGANSDLLSPATVAMMQARRPDLIVAEVPDRGHVPFLDEPEALAALEALLARIPRLTDIGMIRAAATRAEGHIRRTPMLEAESLNRLAGRRVLVKAECLQHTGSFKARGGWAALSAMEPEARARGVIAFSSGNHAQGVARAAAELGAPCVIVMPSDAPAVKIANTRALGAEVVLYDRATEDRDAIAAPLAEARGLTLVKPFDDPQVIAGQGTTGLEIAVQAAEAGVTSADVLTCCGGGGLAAGIALALEADAPGLRVRTVEPAGFDDMARSLAAGGRVGNAAASGSVCDAILTPMPGELTFPVLHRLAGRGLVVTDDEALAAMRAAFGHLRIVLEPGGAAALAAALHRGGGIEGDAVIVVASGGNVDEGVFAAALAVQGRSGAIRKSA